MRDEEFERKLSWAKAKFLKTWEVHIATRAVPFGKHYGELVLNVPLSYLFETVIDCRPSLFTNSIKILLEQHWLIQELLGSHTGDSFHIQGSASWLDVLNSYLNSNCPPDWINPQ